MITVCMTATRRPEILKRTLDSFWEKMFGPAHRHFTLRINVDPVGRNIPSEDVVDAAARYPWDDMQCSLPSAPSFPEAFLRVLTHDDSEWTFLLEEDWELLGPADLNDMISIMTENADLALLRLPDCPAGNQHILKWNVRFPWNGRYFVCPLEQRRAIGFCGHPSLIRTAFLQRTLQLVNPHANPEKQYHYGNRLLIDEVLRWQYGVYGKLDHGPYVRDIGRKWMQENGFTKGVDKAHFTTWSRASQ